MITERKRGREKIETRRGDRRDRQKKEIFILMFHQNRASERLQRDEKIEKRMRSTDKMVKSQGL